MKDVIYKDIQVSEYKRDDLYVVEVRKINDSFIMNYLFKEKVNKDKLFEIAIKHSESEVEKCNN